MKLSERLRLPAAVGLAAALAAGCASSPSDQNMVPPGSGGSASGTGGANAGSGGAKGAATGGSTGSGGSVSGSGGSASSAATCTPGKVPSGTLFSPFDAQPVDVQAPDGHEYYLQVNEWNSAAKMAAQTMPYGGDFFFKLTKQDGSVSTMGGPVGFPSHFIGSNGGHMTAGSNLPKAISALTTVPTSWTWDDAGTLADPTTNSYNATYDVWFSKTAAGDPMTTSSPSGGFLMVWYHKPNDAQPIGSIKYSAVSIPGIPGSWNVWIGMNGSVPCISYVSTTDIKTMSYDLNLFIKDAVNNRPNTIQSTWSLTNVFAGFEIWRGGVNLTSTSFCAVVN